MTSLCFHLLDHGSYLGLEYSKQAQLKEQEEQERLQKEQKQMEQDEAAKRKREEAERVASERLQSRARLNEGASVKINEGQNEII